MVESVRSGQKSIITHCSAGLGRSGVFVTVHAALALHRAGYEVQVADIVRQLRQQRKGIIQTEDQFKFCYLAIAQALDPITPKNLAPHQPRVQFLASPTGQENTRPFSEPILGADSPRTNRRRLYLQQLIPPPPPGAPPSRKPTQLITASEEPEPHPLPSVLPLPTGDTPGTLSPIATADEDTIKDQSETNSLPPIPLSSPTTSVGLPDVPAITTYNQDSHFEDKKPLPAPSLTTDVNSPLPVTLSHTNPLDLANQSNELVGPVAGSSPSDTKEH